MIDIEKVKTTLFLLGYGVQIKVLSGNAYSVFVLGNTRILLRESHNVNGYADHATVNSNRRIYHTDALIQRASKEHDNV